eukprot:TRINITY_DN9566_c0_g1_i1.p2 TRINITY_DN9566_c0_g1~~TRINITY_DN9566_c0_g1_i1.p2  ORF type:complete len:418 (+),score=165.61 TRINITY_DN9566_c0_g1_i1:1626-2879(+)
MAVSAMIIRKIGLDPAPDPDPAPKFPLWIPSAVPGAAVKLPAAAGGKGENAQSESRRRFEQLLSERSGVHLGSSRDEGLRAAAWRGVPGSLRPAVWRLLVGLVPSEGEQSRRDRELRRKRAEFEEYVRKYHPPPAGRCGVDRDDPLPPGLSDEEGRMHRQITKDLTRMGAGLWECSLARTCLHRVLWVWALRHPASGYVQGMHDICAPFLETFLGEQCRLAEAEQPAAAWADRLERLKTEQAEAAEADTYWCLAAVLQPVQDYFTFGQPGIQLALARLGTLCRAVDKELHAAVQQHAEELGMHVEGQQWGQWLAYRWMNCLLLRELPDSRPELACRLFDTYLAEGEAFAQLHVYVSLAMLLHYRSSLVGVEAADAVMAVQRLHTRKVSMADLEAWISQGYLFQQVFEGAGGHLREME